MRLTLEIVRYKIYHFYLDGLNTDVDKHVTVERRTTTMGKGRALQIRDVHSAWTLLLGVNCQIRREVSISFWKLNTIKLRPWTAGLLNSVAFGNIGKIYLEVVSPQRRARKYAFTLSNFRTAIKTLLRLPSLQKIDTAIDVPSVLACIPIQSGGLCRKHAHHIGSSELFQMVRDVLAENWAGYYHFQLHLTNKARLEACGRITQDFPSLSTAPNLSLASCPDHTLGLCNEITCRLLHGIEEMCYERHGDPAWRLYFFEDSSRLTSTWTPGTTIWRPSCGELPLVVDITDLRAKQPTLSHRLRLDDFLFENLYLRNGDFDDEDESVVSE